MEDKNVIFYSLHPNDADSKIFMELLAKNPGLDKQFIKICVYPNIKGIPIPEIIRKINTVPVLIAAGFDKPIVGKNAVSWIQNNQFNSDNANGFDYADIGNGKFSSTCASLQDNDTNNLSSLDQFYHNDNYNTGFAKADNRSQTGNNFANVDSNNRIDTFADSGKKAGLTDVMKHKFDQLQMIRQNELGTADNNGNSNSNTSFSGFNNNNNNNNQNYQQGGFPAYNPNAFAPIGNPTNFDQPQQQQQQQHQLPNFPQFNPMNNNNNNNNNNGNFPNPGFMNNNNQGFPNAGFMDNKQNQQHQPFNMPLVPPQLLQQQQQRQMQFQDQYAQQMPQRQMPQMQMPQMQMPQMQMPQMQMPQRQMPQMQMPQMQMPQMQMPQMQMPQMQMPQMQMPQMQQRQMPDRQMPQMDRQMPDRQMPQMQDRQMQQRPDYSQFGSYSR